LIVILTVPELASSDGDERFLVLAPTGRDAALTCQLLHRVGLDAVICRDLDDVCARIAGEGAAALLVAEEALQPATTVRRLGELLANQQTWSDLPIVLFCSQPGGFADRRTSAVALATLGNVTLLERPLRPITMLSAARAALRARRRQYAARGELAEQQRAVRQRDQFFAMLGHELRNPLSAILMAIEVAERSEVNVASARAVIRRQTGHLARLVDDLLDVARVTSGKIVLQRIPLDLGALVERSFEAGAPSIRAQRLAVTCHRPDQPVIVQGDPVRLEQVVTNILTNAVKYTPAGGRLEIEVAREAEHAIVRVTDSGVGIAADMLDRIFDLFTQVESSLERAKGGMGIGLTLVRRLVALHQGAVEVTSPGLGLGSSFTVRLPLVRDAVSAASAEDGVGSQLTQARNVLVVEDNPDSREMLEQMLLHFGHHVRAVPDGLTGVEAALRQRPDIMLVDIGLPYLDGYEVARRVRLALGPNLLLVALTGYGQPEDQRLALDAGFDVHLTKPANLGKLRELLARPAPYRASS
jgi:signal transduction histidine kinase/CheY-like chemotaxis protein